MPLTQNAIHAARQVVNVHTYLAHVLSLLSLSLSLLQNINVKLPQHEMHIPLKIHRAPFDSDHAVAVPLLYRQSHTAQCRLSHPISPHPPHVLFLWSQPHFIKDFVLNLCWEDENKEFLLLPEVDWLAVVLQYIMGQIGNRQLPWTLKSPKPTSESVEGGQEPLSQNESGVPELK